MNSKIIYIKIFWDSTKENEILTRLEKSYADKVACYYNFSETDLSEKEDLVKDDEYYLVALAHDGKKISRAYLGTGAIYENSRGKSIHYSIKAILKNCPAVENICKLSELSLTADFQNGSYVLLEESELIAEQINYIIYTPVKCCPISRAYEKLDEENTLHPLAQRNEYCRRKYNLPTHSTSCSEYQRDYKRIVHSKAFRRMVDKAQVFSASKGDYYRTRMTHSQAVAQIARQISASLKLNLYLTEAIALGHDIGHTPFGHQGERTLDEILRGEKYDIIQNLNLLNKGRGTDDFHIVMGFKHNYQSVRIAVELEEKYAEIYGMDLSLQTLEGMLKHTKLKRDKFSLCQFIDCDESDLHFEKDFCSTLEGQVVEIADEIAQRGHDLDDALSSGAISVEGFKKYLTLKKMEQLSGVVEGAIKRIDETKKAGRKLVDEDELRNGRIVSAIVSYFVDNAITTSQKSMDEYSKDEFDANGHVITENVIALSMEAQKLNDYLETIISNRVINSPEVSLFDSNAATIVSGLFKAYYDNPRLLHKGTKRRLYIDMRKVSQNVIDFEFGNHAIIEKEFNLIAHKDLEELQGEDEEKFEEYRQKRQILIRGICDFISGMTDTYAINEYNRIIK